MACLGLLLGGIGGMAFAILAAAAAIGLNFNPIPRVDRIRSLGSVASLRRTVVRRIAIRCYLVITYYMITRGTLLSLGWLIISMLGHINGEVPGASQSFVLSTGWLLSRVTFGGCLGSAPPSAFPLEILLLTAAASSMVCFASTGALLERTRSVTWTSSSMTTVFFIVYAFQVTAFTPLNVLSYLLAIVFFFIEALALVMALTHTFESLTPPAASVGSGA